MIDGTTHATDDVYINSPDDWVAVSRAELERLQGIEKALIEDAGEEDKEGAIADLRHLATQGGGGYYYWLNAIADKLEVK